MINMKNTIKIISATAIGAVMMASTAYAGTNLGANVEKIKAPVVNVEEKFKTVRTNQPTKQCYEVQVPVGGNGTSGVFGGTNDALNGQSDALAGAIIGGVIGNKIGSKNNKKDLGTALGIIIGSNIGRNNNNSQSGTYQTQTRCEMQNNFVEQIVSAGYVVTFNLDGQHVTVTMNSHPGQYVTVMKKTSYSISN